ncbi:tetratricopeptide repeat protein [Martelella radicis]|uniref:Flp pilus assembly protein TadD n=1 Tax=Martelella radicis TaxID=1397476 RepID=A0A7W6PA88_9HYPH|nr:hypothetical protein [Martelella radicis]MBB4123082.1 Flp pilus assembly protein TadD [Martelella radicis]
MRFFVPAFLTMFLLVPLAGLSAHAQTDGGEASSVETPSDPLDAMYRKLSRTRDPDLAAVFAKDIDDYLDRSPSATVSLLIKWSDEAEADGRTAAALDFLSEAIALRPDEPAAYRKRAVIHYTHGDFNRAMDDIGSALKLEPRDFGGLGLMATILDRTGRPEAALQVWRRYLDFYPADRDVGAYVDNTENDLAGRRL